MILIGRTHLAPSISMIIFSFSLALGVVPTLSSIPLILPAGTIGTGFGIYKTAWSIGSVFQDIIAGKLQDDTLGPQFSYDKTMIFMISISVISVLITIVIMLVDQLGWKSHLSLGSLNTNYVDNNWVEYLSESNQIQPRWYNVIPPVLLTLTLIASWLLFIIFFF